MVIGKLNVLLGLNNAQFRSGLQQSGNQVHTFRRQVTGSTSVLSKLSTVISTVTVAAAAFFAVMGTAKPAEAFNQSMASSTAIMGNLSQEMRQSMGQVAKEVATDTKFSAQEAAGAYYYLASAGMDASQSMAALPQVARFAQAGMFDLATATDLATDAQSALGLVVPEAEQNLANLTRVTDVLVKANTLANASVQQFSEGLTMKSGAALRALGKDIEEGVAVLAAFADQGVKGSEAGTQFAIVLRDLQTKAIQNATAFKDARVNVFDAAGEMRNVADIVGDLESRLDGLSDKAQKSTLLDLGFSDKSVSALQTLLGTSDKIREYEAELRNAGGTTAEVANNQLPTFTKGWEKVKTLFERLSIVIFTPALETLGHVMLAYAPVFEIFVKVLEDASASLGRFFGAIYAGLERVGLVPAATDKIAQSATAATPQVGAMADATARLNEIAAETPAAMDTAASSVDRFIKSMRDEIRFEGLEGPTLELTKMWIDGAFKIGEETRRLEDAAGNFAERQIPVIDFEAYNRARDALNDVLEMQRQQEEFAKRTREHEQAMAKGRSLTQSLETPIEGFKRRIANANSLVEVGAIGWETYQREIAAAREELIRLQTQAKGPALLEEGTQEFYAAMDEWKRRGEAIKAMPDVPMPDMGPGPVSQQPKLPDTPPEPEPEAIRFRRPEPPPEPEPMNPVEMVYGQQVKQEPMIPEPLPKQEAMSPKPSRPAIPQERIVQVTPKAVVAKEPEWTRYKRPEPVEPEWTRYERPEPEPIRQRVEIDQAAMPKPIEPEPIRRGVVFDVPEMPNIESPEPAQRRREAVDDRSSRRDSRQSAEGVRGRSAETEKQVEKLIAKADSMIAELKTVASEAGLTTDASNRTAAAVEQLEMPETMEM